MNIKTEPTSLEDISIFINLFKKKFNGFKSRAPIFFTFIISPLKVFIQIEGQTNYIEFNIDYNKSVGETISEIKNYLRIHEYPLISNIEIKNVEPEIHDINAKIKNEGISFNQAFILLSKIKINTEYIIDKIDIAKNKVVLIEKDNFDNSSIYQVKIPVLILLKRMRMQTITNAYFEFMKYAKQVNKEEIKNEI